MHDSNIEQFDYMIVETNTWCLLSRSGILTSM